MSLRMKNRKMPQVNLRDSRLTRAQMRALRRAREGAVRSAEMLRESGLSKAQIRAMRRAQKRAMQTARETASRLGPTAGQARRMASTGVENARVWSAPRVDRAGHYVERELGPRVGTMLRRTADRIEPARRRGRRGVAATLLLAGGALGAAGAFATRRNAARKQAEEQGTPGHGEHLSSVSSSGEHAHSS